MIAGMKVWLKLEQQDPGKPAMRPMLKKALACAAGLPTATVPAHAGGTGGGAAGYVIDLREAHGTGDMPVLSFPANLPSPLIFYTFPSGQIKTLNFPGGVLIKIAYIASRGIRFVVMRRNSQGKWDWSTYDELPNGIQYVVKKELPPSTGQ
jgi:hypothetical protein